MSYALWKALASDDTEKVPQCYQPVFVQLIFVLVTFPAIGMDIQASYALHAGLLACIRKLLQHSHHKCAAASLHVLTFLLLAPLPWDAVVYVLSRELPAIFSIRTDTDAV